MGNKRQERLNEQFKREVTGILRTEVRDPRVGLPTVTRVEVTPDLWVARISVRPDPAAADPEALMEGLEAAAPFIRRELGKVMHLRRIPELRFQEDRTLEQALRIEKILSEVLPPEPDDAEEPGPDSEGSSEVVEDPKPEEQG
jgi:ribosome-binding factor A